VQEIFPYLISGAVLGLTAGATPGPLNTLVISETIRNGRKAGLLVALAPALSDLPVILLCVFVVASLEEFGAVIGLISVCGALYLAYLAYECFTVKGTGQAAAGSAPESLRKGLVANLLNPNPYIFWLTVGATTIMSGYRTGIPAAAAFLASFYVCIVGVKILIAMVVDRFRSFMGSSAYRCILRVMGAALLVFAVIYLRDGLGLLGII
jgi:threonine/homoserine/homoserine lactone efflux protein